MTREGVLAAAKRVVEWHKRFADLSGRKKPQGHSLIYPKGLLSDQKRKSVESIALQVCAGAQRCPATQKEVVATQEFPTRSPWDASDVFQEIQAVFAEELVPTSTTRPLGVAGVIDESGFEKAGTESVGVARRWCGRLGTTENCQVGVILLGVAPA